MRSESTRLDPKSAQWFSRGTLIDEVSTRIHTRRQDLALLGFRGMGKTSLLAAVEGALGASDAPSPGAVVIVHTDCALVADVAAQPEDICAYLAAQWNRSLGTDLFPPGLRLTGADLPQYLRGRPHTSYLLLVFDDFDKLGQQAGDQVAAALLGLLNVGGPYLRCLLSAAVDLPTLAGRIDAPLSLLTQQLTLKRIELLPLERDELRRFAATYYAVPTLHPREVDFLVANSGGHPALLHAGLAVLARYRPASGPADTAALLDAYQALGVEAQGLPQRILYDLLLDQPLHQHLRFYLYGLARQQRTWVQRVRAPRPAKATPAAAAPRGLRRDIAIEHQFWERSLLERTDQTARLFSDFAAETWARQSTTDAAWRETVLAPVRDKMSALELCIFELFCQHPGREFGEEEIQAACWPPGEPPRRGDRTVYAAVMRVCAKLDAEQNIWQIKKQGRGRGWVLVSRDSNAS